MQPKDISAMARCELSQGTGQVHEAGGVQENVDTVEGPHDEPCAAPNVHFWVVLDSCFRAYAWGAQGDLDTARLHGLQALHYMGAPLPADSPAKASLFASCVGLVRGRVSGC